ncbi:MAG: hypothetical protein M0R37_13735 [Bacteroidales bacterium]|jgi:hypothetical protein|nr:hypothetical protein [Bacteroidales bacterium]
MSVASDIELNVSRVEGENRKALDTLNGKWFKSSDTEAAISALTSLKKTIAAWATRGRNAVKAGAGKMPPEKWSGWVKAGEVFIDGIHDLGEFGAKSSLVDIADTTVEAVKDAPKQVARAVKATAKAVGETAGAVVTPLLLPLVVIAAIAIALVYVLHRAGVL